MDQARLRQTLIAEFNRSRARLRYALRSPAGLLSDADREAIETDIHDEARLTSAYSLMLFAACGIAALGLLQSSAAVVIGAMLISPLMAPIISIGMALARVEPREFKNATITLAVGAALAVLASTLIVWASPLKDVTPEILSRTRPTLLDLVVALLSGFVGAYLSINRKGGSIAGVAIATALMPPLAVIGYGLATGSWGIAAGATLLFMTNVVAILAAVFGVARRYGFRPTKQRGAAWEIPALFATILVLCVPLALSLRNIVTEAREITKVRSAIEHAFAGARPHITDLAVRTDGGATDVQSVVVTRRYVADAASRIARQLNPGSTVSIEQVVAASGLAAANADRAGLANRLEAGGRTVIGPEGRLRAMLGASGRVQAIDRQGQDLTVTFAMAPTSGLSDYRVVEQAAQRFVPEARVIVVPPIAPLPNLDFARGSSRLDATALETLDTIAWALNRWSIATVTVEGRASPNRRRGRETADPRTAQARADAVAAALKARGVTDIRQTILAPGTLAGNEAQYLKARVVARPSATSVDERPLPPKT